METSVVVNLTTLAALFVWGGENGWSFEGISCSLYVKSLFLCRVLYVRSSVIVINLLITLHFVCECYLFIQSTYQSSQVLYVRSSFN
jgi:hypothetical protein